MVHERDFASPADENVIERFGGDYLIDFVLGDVEPLISNAEGIANRHARSGF